VGIGKGGSGVKLPTRAEGAAERSTAAPSFGYTPAVLRRTIATQTWMVGVRAYLHARNALFGRAPDLGDALMRVTNVGGRGRGLEGDSGARYFHAVLEDYEFIAAHAGVVREPHELFRGRTLLELGPGNTRAVALLALSRGAHSWSGCDRFDVITDSEARASSPPPGAAPTSCSRARCSSTCATSTTSSRRCARPPPTTPC
jgi:hypothetical protein